MAPTPVTSWRMAVLMGANSRTYKFALGAALLDLAKEGRTEVSLEELAIPYAWRMAEHAAKSAQGSPESLGGPKDFLRVLANEHELSLHTGRPTDRLVAAAIDSMPGMVMQKFHNFPGVGQINHSFYELRGRGTARQVVLSRDLHRVAQEEALANELAARWSIVEASFDAGVGRGLVGPAMSLSKDAQHLLMNTPRRVALTSARPALTGFQHGLCFYCPEPLSTAPGQIHMDHVYAFAFMKRTFWADGPDLNRVWNLVAAHPGCNQRKGSRLPKGEEVERLLARNDAIANSPHPLRRTLARDMAISGRLARTSADRSAFVGEVHLRALEGRRT